MQPVYFVAYAALTFVVGYNVHRLVGPRKRIPSALKRFSIAYWSGAVLLLQLCIHFGIHY